MVILRERLLGIERDGAMRDRERFVDLAGIAQRDREIGVPLGIIRVGDDRTAVRRDRVGSALLFLEDDAEIGPGRSVIRLQQQRVLAGRDRLVQFAELGETGTEVAAITWSDGSRAKLRL
ncbi:hypothetical protein IQ16_06747 [Bradyrhizobium huanghuaihaiense]|uniref:Uncharacterized protein n=1 Tax=Bradyrhizobium huanghuaihaiense TaxID=990078 RepID=A0A562R1U4_9BRAD|nr:hypothetical protein IQ16_06747 [Bradyrhizobium huanghuaihaiense]